MDPMRAAGFIRIETAYVTGLTSLHTKTTWIIQAADLPRLEEFLASVRAEDGDRRVVVLRVSDDGQLIDDWVREDCRGELLAFLDDLSAF